MLGSRFSFEAYAKNEREKAAKCLVKTTDVQWDSDGHTLT